MSNLGINFIDALASKYNGEIKCANATLQVYLTNPVGIGEHPQHLDEMDKLIDTIATNLDKLDVLSKVSSNTLLSSLE